MRHKRLIVAAAAVGLLIGVPTAGAAATSVITGDDVKNNSLTGFDIENGSIHKRELDQRLQQSLAERAVNGATGATGAQGVKGDTGATGPAGKNGVKGDTGTKGADSIVAGPQGDKGENGLSTFDIWLALPGDKGAGDEASFISKLTGAQGEQGERGLPGEQGPQGDVGPVGPAGGITGYERVTATTTNSKTVAVDCPADKIVLGGGGSVDDGIDGQQQSDHFLYLNQPTANGWEVGGSQVHGNWNSGRLNVWAICATA